MNLLLLISRIYRLVRCGIVGGGSADQDVLVTWDVESAEYSVQVPLDKFLRLSLSLLRSG